jgi:uncharacterized protein involved in outer membrane biogenesis
MGKFLWRLWRRYAPGAARRQLAIAPLPLGYIGERFWAAALLSIAACPMSFADGQGNFMSQGAAARPRGRFSVKGQIFAASLLAIVLLIWFWNWDWFIPFVESSASSAIGRKVTIQHMHVRLGGATDVALTGVTIANPDEFTGTEPFLTADRLVVDANVLDYIKHQIIVLPLIEIDHPVAAVRQLGDGRDNYTFHFPASKPNGKPAPPPRLGNLVINDGQASVIMPKLKTNFDLAIQTKASPDPHFIKGDEIVVDAHGTYAGAPVTGHFIGGALLSLRDAANPYPVDLHVANGTTHAALTGTIEQPASFGGANLTLALSGQDMANLYQLTGVPIPGTPPYSITGKLDYHQNAFRLSDIAGRLGSSDLEGTITESTPTDGSRRLVTADLTSRRVDLTDLAGFLGATPGKTTTPGQDKATKIAQARADEKPNLIPDTPINLPKINAANVEFRYRGEHIINKDAPLDDVVINLSIENGRITAHPVSFAVGGGTIAINLDLHPVEATLHTTANVDFRRIPLARLMASTRAFAGDGTIGGSAHVTGTGNSMAAILGHGDGGLQLFMNQGGDVSALLVDLAGLQVGDAALSALGIPNKTQIQCLVSDFALQNGVVDTKTLLVATKEANILGAGTINLETEQLNLALKTSATHFQIGSLSTPINFGGTLKHPSVLPAAGPLAAKAGAAIGLGILFPPLALLPTIRLGLGDQNACDDTLQALHAGTPHNPD